MPLLLIRHAEAVPENARLIDESRHLTAAGRTAARDAGATLAGAPLDRLFTSPLVRAVQTAELVAAAAGFTGVIEVLPELAPGGDLRAIQAMAARWPGVTGLVGHEPSLSALAALLTGQKKHRSLEKAEILPIA